MVEPKDKIENIINWWQDDCLKLTVSKTTNSIYIKFKNKKSVRISDHVTFSYKWNWIDISLDIWEIQRILLKISNS